MEDRRYKGTREPQSKAGVKKLIRQPAYGGKKADKSKTKGKEQG